MRIEDPYLLFLGDVGDQLAAKTAQGIVDWRPEKCLGQLRLADCRADVGLADLSIAEAVKGGARSLVIGGVNAGGTVPQSWWPTLVEGLEAGLHIASGLHTRLLDIAPVAEAAAKSTGDILEVRRPDQAFGAGQGTPRPGRRLLTVGTDCSVGKMYAALAIEREMNRRGLTTTFRATGQTGILITGAGISIDAVVADFISGATEWLCPANQPDHWDIVEGQGSLFHPSYAGVSLGLLHGAQPDALVLCHEPTRGHMRGLPDCPLPTITDCLEATLAAARLTNPAVRCIGLAVNTSALPEDGAAACLEALESETGLPCVDPVTTGPARLVDEIERLWPS